MQPFQLDEAGTVALLLGQEVMQRVSLQHQLAAALKENTALKARLDQMQEDEAVDLAKPETPG